MESTDAGDSADIFFNAIQSQEVKPDLYQSGQAYSSYTWSMYIRLCIHHRPSFTSSARGAGAAESDGRGFRLCL